MAEHIFSFASDVCMVSIFKTIVIKFKLRLAVGFYATDSRLHEVQQSSEGRVTGSAGQAASL